MTDFFCSLASTNLMHSCSQFQFILVTVLRIPCGEGRRKARGGLEPMLPESRREVEGGGSFWQARYYDFNTWAEAKRIKKLRYIHRNPVNRGLVSGPELWA